MTLDLTIRRAQVYRLLSEAFLYPRDNWTDDLPLLTDILADLDFGPAAPPQVAPLGLVELQNEHRHTFGLAGSLCYETEYGLAHEFRQSQEMADINGFYRAFGFTIGGPVRERPDHVSVELEFMSVLALKEAYAAKQGIVEHEEVCVEAQRKFLADHLGPWFGLFAQSLAQNATGQTYPALTEFAVAFIEADAARLGLTLERLPLETVQHTPFDPNFSCADCPVAEMAE
jgi:DMSO reductase family type II enzyme chaperone